MPLPLLLTPWTHQAQSNPTALSGLTAAIVGGLIAPEWDAPTQRAASIPGTPQVGETPTADIPNVVNADGLNHAAFTCHRAVGAAANAGIPDATGTTRSRSDQDDGRSPAMRGSPFPTTETARKPPTATWLRIPRGRAKRHRTRRWKPETRPSALHGRRP